MSKRQFNILMGLVTSLLVLFFISCKKADNQPTSQPTNQPIPTPVPPPITYFKPELSIDSIINMSNTSVRVYVSILSIGGGDSLAFIGADYHLSGQISNIYININNMIKTVGSSFFDINNLQPATRYSVDFYAYNKGWKDSSVSSSFATLPPVLGQQFGGGKCAYILQPGDNGYDPSNVHGFMVSWVINGSQVIAASANWGCIGTLIGCNQTAIGSGAQNSNKMWGCASNGGTALRYCFDYNGNNPFATPSVWFLPSTEELSKIYLNRTQIGLVIGATSKMNYWSSTESDVNNAIVVNLSLGSQYPMNKSATLNVLAIRYF